MKNTTLQRKIVWSHSAALVILAIVVIWAVTNLMSLGRASEAILQENYRSILAAESMLDAIERQDSAVLLDFIEQSSKDSSIFQTNQVQFIQWLSRAQDNITIPAERRILTSIDSLYASYIMHASSMRFSSMNRTEAARLYHTTLFPVFLDIRSLIISLREVNQRTMYQASEKARSLAHRAVISTTGIGVAGILLGIVLSMFISHQITRPLHRMMHAIRQIGQGQYDVEVPADSGDELGHLATEINTMAQELSHFHDMNIEQIVEEKNKSEAILQSIDDGVMLVNKDYQIIETNPAADRLLHTAGWIRKQNNSRFAQLDDRLSSLLDQVLESGEAPDLTEEKRIVTIESGGQIKHYSYFISPIQGQQDHLLGAVLLFRDVTRLRELDRLKSEFVMAASHELRTPLTSIGMSIGLLMKHVKNTLDPKEQELLTAAQDEVRHLKSLVSDLLELSKIEAGRIDLQFQSVPVEILIDRVRSVFRGQLEPKNITFTVNVSENLPAIRADANKITWVLTNLISNALRYTPEGGKINLDVEQFGQFLHWSVSDEGPGIPPEYQSKIFQKFVQVGGREAGGSGLGLSISKEVVRAHGGSIWVESTEGKGSTFTFAIPTQTSDENREGRDETYSDY